MTKARTLANFISDGSTLADGAISVSEVSGAAPLASPNFTGNLTVDTNTLYVDAGNNRVGIVNAAPSSTFVVNVDGATGNLGGQDWNADKWLVVSDGTAASASGFGITHTETYGTLMSSIDPFTAWRDIEMEGNEFRYLYTGSNELLTINGTEVVINEQGANTDFRVESDSTAYMLFVDAGQNAVTINGSTVAGDATYKYPLSVRANTAADAIAVVGRTNDDIGELGFYESDGTTQLGNVQARPSDGGMRFRALPTSATMHFDLTDSSGNLQNRMLFQEAELRINDPGDDYDFRVESDSNAYALFVDAGNDTVNINRSSGSGKLNIRRNTSGTSLFLYNANNNYPSGGTGYSDIDAGFYDYLTGGDFAGGTARVRFESANAFQTGRSARVLIMASPAGGTNIAR